MSEYFTDDELKCRCCGMMNIDDAFLVKLNIARELAGFPFEIESGCRCEKHNREVGSHTKNHVWGKAVDIRCVDAHLRFRIVEVLQSVGILGIGIGKTFVHGDTNRTVSSIWTY